MESLRSHFDDVRIVRGRANDLGSTFINDTAIVVYEAQKVDQGVSQFIDSLRKTKFMGPVVVVATIPHKLNVEGFAASRNVEFVDKPYVGSDLVGLVWKHVVMVKEKQRQHRRFDVQEKAIIETYGTDFKTETMIHNISEGGVLIQGALKGLREGELLRIHFNFDKIKKERVMSARVVWLKKGSDNKQQAGLQFVSQKSVYKYLLNYALA